MHYIALHYITLHYITLHYIKYIPAYVHAYIHLYIGFAHKQTLSLSQSVYEYARAFVALTTSYVQMNQGSN